MRNNYKFVQCTGGNFSFCQHYIDYDKYMIEKLRSERKQKLKKLNKYENFKKK